MLLILKTVDRVCGDVRKLVVFVRFPVAVGTRSGYFGDNVTDNLYLGLVVGDIPDAVTQAVKVIHDCRQTVFGSLLGSVGDSQVILRFGFRFVGGLDGVIDGLQILYGKQHLAVFFLNAFAVEDLVDESKFFTHNCI